MSADAANTRKFTMRDVANHANVSTATVSRVLTGQGCVQQEKVYRVLHSVSILKYEINEAAAHLAKHPRRPSTRQNHRVAPFEAGSPKPTDGNQQE